MHKEKLAAKEKRDQEIKELNEKNRIQFEKDLQEKKDKVYSNSWLQAYCYKYTICKIEKHSITFKSGLKISFEKPLFTKASGGRTVDSLKGHTVSTDFKIEVEPTYPKYAADQDILDAIVTAEGLGLYEDMISRSQRWLRMFMGKFCKEGCRFTLHKFVQNYRNFMDYGLSSSTFYWRVSRLEFLF